MSTRKTVFQKAARRIGGHTGSIASGTNATAVLTGLVDSTGDDTALEGDLLWMLDAASAADNERVIATWDDSAGRATWEVARTDVTYTSENFIVVPRSHFNLNTWRNALNDRLSNTRRVVWNVIPTMQDERLYPLNHLTWIRGAEDVRGLYYRASPNLIDNSDFDTWGNGTASAPTNWTAGSATVGRNALPSANVSHGYYSVSLAGSGAAGTLDYELDPRLVVQLRGQTVTFESEVLSAGSAVIRIVEGTSATASATHTGGGARETLSASVAIGSTTTRIRFRLESPDATTSHFDHAVAEEASSIQSILSTAGDDSWRRLRLDAQVVNIGGVTYIELPSPKGRRAQIVVASLQPYPTLSADTDTTDCPDTVIVPGLLYELSRVNVANVDRTRWDRIQGEQGREYAVNARALQQIPVPASQERVVVRGA